MSILSLLTSWFRFPELVSVAYHPSSSRAGTDSPLARAEHAGHDIADIATHAKGRIVRAAQVPVKPFPGMPTATCRGGGGLE